MVEALRRYLRPDVLTLFATLANVVLRVRCLHRGGTRDEFHADDAVGAACRRRRVDVAGGVLPGCPENGLVGDGFRRAAGAIFVPVHIRLWDKFPVPPDVSRSLLPLALLAMLVAARRCRAAAPGVKAAAAALKRMSSSKSSGFDFLAPPPALPPPAPPNLRLMQPRRRRAAC